MNINPARWKTRPTPEQVEGVKLLTSVPDTALFDTMGFGKSKQVVDAACELFLAGEIDTVLIVCPASLKFNWMDASLGQLAQHNWVDSYCFDFSSRSTTLPELPVGNVLTWLIVSYEYVKTVRAMEVIQNELRGRKVWIVADEAHYLANHKSLRTKQIIDLRRTLAVRATVLTGTPLGNRHILNLYSIFDFLNPKILNFQNFYHFRARHCQLGGYQNKQVLRYFDENVIEEKIRPHTLRRTKIEGLKDKRYQMLEVSLSDETWRMYRQMRDELVVWLDSGEASVAQHAFTRVLRLAQLTSGVLGGLDDDGELREVSSEKPDFLVGWLRQLKESAEPVRIILWCRFRAEVHRLVRLLEPLGIPCFLLLGGQADSEREESVREFTQGSPRAPAILVAQPKAGGLGYSFHTTCSRNFYVSNDRNLLDRQQSEDRTWRRGQLNDVMYWDLLATGPRGQKTIDHTILRNLRAGIALHTLTMDQWRKILEEE